MVVAGAILVPIWLYRREPLPQPRDGVAIALGGFFFAVDMASLNASILLASPAAATLISNTTPLFVGIASLVAFGKRQPHRFWLGFALALGGCAAIAGVDGAGHPATLTGDALAFASAGAFAAYLLLTERSRTRVGSFAFAALSVTSSAAVLGLYCLACRLPLAGFDARTWGAFLGLGIVAQVGGYLAIGRALAGLSAATVSVSLLLQAVVTALLSVVVFHDRLTPAEIAGGAIVLAGVAIVNLPPRRIAVPG